MFARFVTIALLCISATGCTTFETSQVSREGATRGYPFIFSKPYRAVVTYTDNTQSAHILSVPTLYAVDVKQSPFGTTDTSLENNDDGFAKKTTAKIDQKVAENLGAVTNLLKELGIKVAGAAAPGAPDAVFSPDLVPGKNVLKLDLQPL